MIAKAAELNAHFEPNSIALNALHRWMKEFEEHEHPYHPTLRLAERLVTDDVVAPGELSDLMNAVNTNALIQRGQTMARNLGTTVVEENRDALKESIRRLAYKDGQKLSAEQFSERLRGLYGVVFTGHPTFSMNPKTSGALAQYFTAVAADDEYEIKLALGRLKLAANLDYNAPDLKSESDQSIVAIKNLRQAMSVVEDVAIEVGQEEYINDWEGIDYAPNTVATWIPTDWDGREDITWNMVMAYSINLRVEGLRLYQLQLDGLYELVKGQDRNTVTRLLKKIDTSIADLEEHQRFFAEYDPAHDLAHDPDGEKLKAHVRAFENSAKTRITHPDELIGPLQKILDKGEASLEVQRMLVQLRSQLGNHGITLAHSHYRINAGKSVIPALERQMKHPIHPLLKEEGNLDSSYAHTVTEMIAEAQKNGHSLDQINKAIEAIDQQMAVIAATTEHLDTHTPVRFLIAETHYAIVPLAALYFAKKHGIEDKIDICPLFEDRNGVDAATKIVDRLYRNPEYIEYIKQRGVASFQLGYSDSGRFDGQPGAAAFMELIKGLIIKIHKEKGLEDVPIRFFDTHGESIGRGTHPGDVYDRLGHVHTAYNLNSAALRDLKLMEEESFQGQDGFMMHGTPEASLAYLTRAIDHLTADHSDIVNDAFYGPGKDEARLFFSLVRAHHAHSWRKEGGKPDDVDPDYSLFINLFGRFMPTTGSRAVARSSSKLPRAIPHNGIFAQVGELVNVIYGVSHAIDANPENFEYLMKESPAFRKRMDMVFRAMDVSDPGILASYIALYDPTYWVKKGDQAQTNEEREYCFEISKQLENSGYCQKLRPFVRKFTTDFVRIQQARKDLDLPDDPMKDPVYAQAIETTKNDMRLVHAARMGKMIDMFKLSVKLGGREVDPDVRAQFIQDIISLDSEAPERVRRASNDDPDIERLQDDMAFLPKASRVLMNMGPTGVG